MIVTNAATVVPMAPIAPMPRPVSIGSASVANSRAAPAIRLSVNAQSRPALRTPMV